MKRYISLLLGILAFVPISAQQSDYYYYYKGNRIDLEVDSTRLHVVSEGLLQAEATTARIRMANYDISASTKSYVYNHVVPLQQRRSAVPEVYFSTLEIPEKLNTTHYEALVEKVRSEDNVWQVLPSFKLNGKWVDVTNNFFVKLKSANDVSKLQEMANQYGVEIVGYNKSMPLWYTLSCTSFSTVNAIEASGLFYRSDIFACCEPEFRFYDLARSNDELYGEQWGLNKNNENNTRVLTAEVDINIEEAWSVTEGEGVVVAVFDSGVSTTHPDLNDNIYTEYSYDAITNSEPAVIVRNNDGTNNNHGTACAGIIAAERNNEIGICGVAPKAKIMSISIDLGSPTEQQIANGIINACNNGADIINCSWGGISSPLGYIDEAIWYAMQYGRNGKGALLVFASGNDGGGLLYPENSDPRILTVGAVSPCGLRLRNGVCGYIFTNLRSCYDETLDVVAPGIYISTTDVTGSNGYVVNGYTDSFGGTSAACAYVSGVAALVLSVYPQLRVEELAQVIERTTQKITTDIYPYSTDTIHRSGTWYEEVGYGLVDAGAAVTTPLKDLIVSHYRNRVIEYGEYDGYLDYNIEAENIKVCAPDACLQLGVVNKLVIKNRFIVEKGSRLELFNVVYNAEHDWFEYISQ